MIIQKYVCDACGKESKSPAVEIRITEHEGDHRRFSMDLCRECYDKVRDTIGEENIGRICG